ncbi:MAG: type II toxin-antitoxin system prevent-host-death family antitoxin [Holophagales bacterium]|nr:type II toxin-antitoxin system prevent-host-death family antitoxin [Holophagales bacterium]
MKSIAISRFKAECLGLLEEVRQTGQPLLITKRGEPIAQVGPPAPAAARRDVLGAMAGTVRTLEDIVEPLGEDDWEAAR